MQEPLAFLRYNVYNSMRELRLSTSHTHTHTHIHTHEYIIIFVRINCVYVVANVEGYSICCLMQLQVDDYNYGLSSTSTAVCVVPDNPTNTDNRSRVDTTPKKSTPTKPVVIHDNSDTEISPKKSKIVDSDNDSEEQQPSSTIRNGDSPAAPRCKGLRDLKIVGEVSNEWSSDESDKFPAKPGR